MKIREATSFDISIFLELNSEVQALHANAEPKIFKPAKDVNLSKDDFEKLLAQPEMKIYIAEREGLALGYCFAQVWDRPENPYQYAMKKLYINHLAVRSKNRNSGVGTALLKHALKEAKLAGIQRVELDSWTFNGDAISFFLKSGFKVFNQRMFIEI